MTPNKIIYHSLIGIALIVGFFGGAVYERSQQPALLNGLFENQSVEQKNIDFDIFWDAWDILHTRFVDRDTLNTDELVQGAVRGMVEAAGDPYTVFFPPKESLQFEQEIQVPHQNFHLLVFYLCVYHLFLPPIQPLRDSGIAIF